MDEKNSNYMPLAILGIVAIVAIFGISMLISGNNLKSKAQMMNSAERENTAGQMWDWYSDDAFSDGGSTILKVTMIVGCYDGKDNLRYDKDKSFLSDSVAVDWGNKYCGFTQFLQRNVVCSDYSGTGITLQVQL